MVSVIERLTAVLLDPEGHVSIRGSDEDCRIIQESLAEIEKQLDLFVWDKLQKTSLDDLIYQFTEDLDLDALKDWCTILSVDYDVESWLDDDYPEKDMELRTQLAEAMTKLSI